jgi:hypothetical protein
VILARDPEVLDAMFDFYAPEATRIVDVCCNRRKMWKGTKWGSKVVGYDLNPEMNPDVVTGWDDLPDPDSSIDVLCYDPPHLPAAAATQASLKQYVEAYGLKQTCTGDNVAALHLPFLVEAKRVLRYDGLIFAKIKDYIHNHRYQWNLEYFNDAVRAVGLTPCDLIIKRDPCGGNLKSGRWKKAHHAKNCHCYWAVVRNGRCEPRKVSSANASNTGLVKMAALPSPGALTCYNFFSNKNINSLFGSSASLSHSSVHFIPAMTFFL